MLKKTEGAWLERIHVSLPKPLRRRYVSFAQAYCCGSVETASKVFELVAEAGSRTSWQALR